MPAAVGKPEAAVQQPVPDVGGRFVLGESQHFDVIHFAQRQVHRQFMGQRCIFRRIGHSIIGMNISHQRVLLMRHVGHICVGGKQAGCGCVGVRGVAGQKKISRQIQQAQMPPIAGVKFLPMQQKIGRGRGRIRLGAEVCDIRNALLFVDDQVFDNLQVLGRRLGHQVRGGVAVRASVIHVHVNVAAHPLRACLFGKVQRLQMNRQAGFAPGGNGRPCCRSNRYSNPFMTSTSALPAGTVISALPEV